MATKLYLESSGTPNISPTPNAGWTDQTQFTRFKCGTTKLSSAMVTDDCADALSTQADIIIGQWISDFLDIGQTITGAQTVQIVMRAAEVAANNNLFLTWAVYVFNSTTLQKTVVTKRTDGTEVVATTLTGRTDSATSVAGNYTTVAGDRLVIEVGLSGDPSGANTHNGSISYGSDSATDLTFVDGTTDANNPVVQLTDTLTFNTSSPSPSVSPSVSPSASTSPSSSASLSVSPSGSVSPSSSDSPSVSSSGSVSPSSSESPSTSPSQSVSPSGSASPSVSPSGSESPSASVSPSVSPSASVSPSGSTSPSASQSPSASVSPSPPPPPPEIVFLDPGGDAVQAVEYFALAQGLNSPTYDTSQKVVGVGSYKFDSGAGNGSSYNRVSGVLGQSRRLSFYFRYDSVLNTDAEHIAFASGDADYSGGGFTTAFLLGADDAQDATATPAKNSGQGSLLGDFGLEGAIPEVAIIDSIKIVYERQYDTTDSIGISRVRWVIGEEEGPNHDNTDMPTFATVVEVDITADRTWVLSDLSSIQVIAEARRGDSDVEHTQNWDYVQFRIEYHTSVEILDGLTSPSEIPAFKLEVLPTGSGVVLRVVDADSVSFFDGTTVILPDQDPRITICYVEHGVNDLEVKVYIDSVEELSLTGRSTVPGQDVPTHLIYGWIGQPGANRVCWFDQLYIDAGFDLLDPGPIHMTAKLPASVNADNFDTTGGTGAVDERPVNLANYKQQAGSQVAQNYTLQAAAVGDIDLSGETLVGHMGWVIAKRGATATSSIELTLNGADHAIPDLAETAALRKVGVTDEVYPSDAAGIGLLSSANSSDAFLYECGVIVAYEAPVEDVLFPRYLLLQDSETEVFDDLSASPPTSYELRYWVDGPETGSVLIKVYSIGAEGESSQLQSTVGAGGGPSFGVTRITPGIEVRVLIEVTGADMYVTLDRYLNV